MARLGLWCFLALCTASAGHGLQKRALRRSEASEEGPALVSPTPLTPLSSDEVASAAELDQIQKDLKTSEADRAKITLLQKSLETQQLLAKQSQDVLQSFPGDEYPGSVVHEQQQQLKEIAAQTQSVLGFSAKAAKEASEKALQSAAAIEKAAIQAQHKAEIRREEAKKAAEMSAKLASEAKVELQRVEAATASAVKQDKTEPAQRHDSRVTSAPSRLQKAVTVRKNSTGLVEDDDTADYDESELD
ncbi:hypothetical protein AK812_SmicGene23420 [Symbiodinium microadriaticum]|uniref:Uncharacterized protein n=1 Tax=Symbiodinium microadriaticum TaxID=2951 RepID=A0A1Q9DH74_SYMMI|nr:hypothetical protein AK812_SmicGene23420 [Symbiodinium microadriaticum]CAE7357184.1 unnamed protein product [Symbiodinium microadriaticum]CAE7944259.1 unnamed protein product [Symbiodinium sp. KB8]